MSNVVDFKEELISKLNLCKDQIESIEKESKLDLSFYKEKIKKALQAINEESIKIVLFGSFSDGKSTILSAITGNLGIKIAPEPTTDEIKVYNYKSFLLVDTPGLFSENIPHDEKTKKFISEADLIIFTLEAVNPMKESQHEVIKWLLKDLGKINQVVFVINKMDAVADLYNEDDFNRVCEIKKRVVINTLNSILKWKQEDYKIVCLSADPWAMGLNYWFKNKEEYLKLSRLSMLERIIEQVVEEKKTELKKNTIDSILKDIAIRGSKEFEEYIKRLKIELERLKGEYDDLKDQIILINSELKKAVRRIKHRLEVLRQDIILSLQICNDFDCIKNIIDLKLGEKGDGLKTSIEIIIREELEPIYEYLPDILKILENIVESLQDIDILTGKLLEVVPSIMQKPAKALKSVPTSVLRTSILKLRDFLRLPIKFKPWQALKLAKALQILGVILETLGVIAEIFAKLKFNKVKNELIENINNFFKAVKEGISEESLKKEALSPILDLEKGEREINRTIQYYSNLLEYYGRAKQIFDKCREVI